MADNNNVLTIVLVVAAVLLFSGNLTGNLGRQVPAGSQVAAWCDNPYDPGNPIAAGNYDIQVLENNLAAIVSCDSMGTARITTCPDRALALGSNKAYLNVQDITTDPLSYGCREGRTQAHLSTIGSY